MHKRGAFVSEISNVQVLDQYTNTVRNILVTIRIEKRQNAFTHDYALNISGISKTTEALLEEIRERLIHKLSVKHFAVDDPDHIDPVFEDAITKEFALFFPYAPESTTKVLKSYLLSRALGMGYVDFLLHDEHLEEIAIDNANEPIWVYHRNWGWLKTNIYMSNEEQIQQAASRIARDVGRQINTLNPLLDASLATGERVNATISPITPKGNTITLRKFSQDPWTITKFIDNGTISIAAAALIWQVMQYEMSILVVGGTASGKTSMLNALANFIPPNQRILSIEDTRELRLASFLYWVPMLTRVENAEGRGKISMEDLLVNSLRMRPDRILVGEVRRKKEAETLFEAIHTGHSCYGTFHANDAKEAIARLTNDPVSVPKALIPAIDLMVVQFRNRRTGQRKTFQIAEVTEETQHNILYQYDAKNDQLLKKSKSKRIKNKLTLYTGLTPAELEDDLKQKKFILETLVKNKIFNVEKVGEYFAKYYEDPTSLVKSLKR